MSEGYHQYRMRAPVDRRGSTQAVIIDSLGLHRGSSDVMFRLLLLVPVANPFKVLAVRRHMLDSRSKARPSGAPGPLSAVVPRRIPRGVGESPEVDRSLNADNPRTYCERCQLSQALTAGVFRHEAKKQAEPVAVARDR